MVRPGRPKAWLARPMAPNRHPECPDGAPAKGPAAFNAHSPGGGGSGLVQSVFRSPARPHPGAPAERLVPRAAKRKTLYIIKNTAYAIEPILTPS